VFPIDEARRVLLDAIAAHMFPSAVVDVGSSAVPLWRESFGRLTWSADAPATDVATAFDLASLTKVIATTTIVMVHVGSGRLRLDEPIARYFSEWRGSDRESVTVQDLLEHASGLPARLFDRPPQGRREFEHDICAIPLEYRPRTRSIYSDLGFIFLGFLAADRSGRSLADEFESIRLSVLAAEPTLAMEALGFDLRGARGVRIAATWPLDDDPRRGRALIGEVHDSYAAALGGVAGHSGLFGSAGAVAAFARVWLRATRGQQGLVGPISRELVGRFTTKSNVAGSSRALGWDTMLPTSSCGTRMSPAAIGHVGFTGTSLWIDPMRDRYFVLLTNRVCGGGTQDDMRVVRQSFHDALGQL
jgi:CubicO group peptidase (beta-lactamase class C family)